MPRNGLAPSPIHQLLAIYGLSREPHLVPGPHSETGSQCPPAPSPPIPTDSWILVLAPGIVSCRIGSVPSPVSSRCSWVSPPMLLLSYLCSGGEVVHLCLLRAGAKVDVNFSSSYFLPCLCPCPLRVLGLKFWPVSWSEAMYPRGWFFLCPECPQTLQAGSSCSPLSCLFCHPCKGSALLTLS